MIEQQDPIQIINEALIAQFFEWHRAGVTHVALGCNGFEPVTPQQAQCEGRRAYDIDADHAEILKNMLERLLATMKDAAEAGLGAVLGGKGGTA